MNKPEVYEVLISDSQPFADARIAMAVSDVFQIVREEMMCGEGETGGILLIGVDNIQDVPRCQLLGEFTKYSPDQCYASALEKLQRVYGSVDGISAWQSRDVSGDEKHYGGAIMVGEYCISFHGLSEHLDEALVTVAAMMCGLLSIEDVEPILEVSKNPLFGKLLKAVGQRTRPLT